MKNSFYLLTIVAFVFLIQSCSKETITDQKSDLTSVSHDDHKSSWGIHRHLITDFPEMGDLWCGAPAIDCFDDIVVSSSGSLATPYSNLVSARTNNTIPDFFDNYSYDGLFPGLTTTDVENIINGDYVVSMSQNTEVLNTEIWIVRDQNSDVVYAMPLKITNY